MLGAVSAIVTTGRGGLLSLVIAVVVLYSLFQPHVKASFKKG